MNAVTIPISPATSESSPLNNITVGELTSSAFSFNKILHTLAYWRGLLPLHRIFIFLASGARWGSAWRTKYRCYARNSINRKPTEPVHPSTHLLNGFEPGKAMEG